MEGMWTRFFPAVVKAQEIVRSGAIGKVVAVHADFGFNGADVANYPDHMFYNLNLGGGGLFYVAPYPVAAALQFLGPDRPTRIAAAGVKDKLTGVDLSGAISLHFEGKGIASLMYNIEVRFLAPTTPILPTIISPPSTVSDVPSDSHRVGRCIESRFLPATQKIASALPVLSSTCISFALCSFRPVMGGLRVINLQVGVYCIPRPMIRAHVVSYELPATAFPAFTTTSTATVAPTPFFHGVPPLLCAGRNPRRNCHHWYERPHQVAFPCPLSDGDRSHVKRKRTRFVNPFLHKLKQVGRRC